MQGSEREAQVRAELEQIMPVVSRLTGLPSQWSGRVELVTEADFLGQKRFSCDIFILQAVASQPERWSTLIHEALHAISAGYIRNDFLTLPGWEEGTVEQLQRLLRPQILSQLGIAVPESAFAFREINHPYNAYISALEKIRTVLRVSEVQFYQSLLATPIAGRPASVFSQVRRLPHEKQRDAFAVLSASNATLRVRL